jgi:hypothetical protein
MRGYFKTPSVFVINDDVDVNVRLSCAVPALYLLTHEYEFDENVVGGITYLNKWLDWFVVAATAP